MRRRTGEALLRIARRQLSLKLVNLLHPNVSALAHLHVLYVGDSAATQQVVETCIDVLGEIDAYRVGL